MLSIVWSIRVDAASFQEWTATERSLSLSNNQVVVDALLHALFCTGWKDYTGRSMNEAQYPRCAIEQLATAAAQHAKTLHSPALHCH